MAARGGCGFGLHIDWKRVKENFKGILISRFYSKIKEEGKVSLVHVRLRQRLFLEHVVSRVSWLDRTSLRILMGVKSESLRHKGPFAKMSL